MKQLLVVFFILMSLKSVCQTTYHHGIFWGRLVLSDKITNKLKGELYLQKRTQNIPAEKSIFGAPHFTSVWLWLNYNLTPKTRLSVSPFGYFNSYAFLTKASDVDVPGVKEFRWVVRLENTQSLKYFNYSNRYSVEYRIRDLNHDGVYQPNWRLRYQARLEKPVKGILPNNKPVSFFAADEVFIQFGKAVRKYPNVFDQNRFSAGFSLELMKNVSLSLSYLNIMQERLNGKDFDNANCVWGILTFDNLFSQFKKKQ